MFFVSTVAQTYSIVPLQDGRLHLLVIFYFISPLVNKSVSQRDLKPSTLCNIGNHKTVS